MKSLTLFIALCLLASCERKEQTPPPAGLKSTDLPNAIHSREIEEKESHYIEIVISEDKSEIFHEGKPVTTTTNPEDLFTALKKLREKNDTMGYTSPLLISAPRSTPFTAIVERIRTAAETGISQMLFLVRTDQTSETRVVFTELAKMGHPLPKIDPYFLHITSEGHIYSGNDSARTLLENNNQNPRLENLSEQLELFSSAARAAGITNAPCQIYVDPKATYQRVIDLISLTNKYQIQPFFTDMIPETESKHIPEPRVKPSSPTSATLRPAPKE